MQVDMRREPRHLGPALYTISWHSQEGKQISAQAEGIDLSDSGVRIAFPTELQPGAVVFIRAEFGHPTGLAIVRHCARGDSNYVIGIELNVDAGAAGVSPSDEGIDYYEFLQISSKAEMATIQRIYRFLAGRYHPDNPETGDPEKFLLL